MEVSYRKKVVTSRYSFSEPSSPVDPASQFLAETVTYKKPLAPYVDADVPLEHFHTMPLPGIKRKPKKSSDSIGSRSKNPPKPAHNTIVTTRPRANLSGPPGGRQSPPKPGKPKKSKHHRHALNAVVSTHRSVPSLLVAPFKPPSNSNPAQARSPMIAGGLKDYHACACVPHAFFLYAGAPRTPPPPPPPSYDNAIYKLNMAIEQTSAQDKRALYISHFIRGLSLAAKDAYPQAAKDFTKCAQLDKSDALSYFNRGVAYAKLHDLGRAIEDFGKAIRRDKNNADFYLNRALLLRQQGDFVSAQKDYFLVKQVSPREPTPI
jgi:hypothetical protein